MQNVLLILQILTSFFLIVVVLVQSRGQGLSRTFGGGGNVSFTRRGLERIVFKATFVLSALFIVLSILQVLV